MADKKGSVTVVEEKDSGLNKRFKDTKTGKTMTRGEFADAIEKGEYEDYHVMKSEGKRIPRSNPGVENLE
ncbi:hypothetical protein CR205_13815 [Alteribacter lacisalsi]|uniref:DUF3892 domain-containing protein n=1 Tax=Alteribacter lacisalsi TaxID=2045244 RepID=A0A2W0H6Z6_9BACI|nr:hypothetical protein [Alteribacter lacisalsi]PYZ96761.1 hypothetical protein CR205_13815 [Alteribacter lacisalsi]